MCVCFAVGACIPIRRSFGGVVLLKLMEELANDEDEGDKDEDKGESAAARGTGIRASMAGGAFLCSVPPSGNGPMTKRFIKEVTIYGAGCRCCCLLSLGWITRRSALRGLMPSIFRRNHSGYGREW